MQVNLGNYPNASNDNPGIITINRKDVEGYIAKYVNQRHVLVTVNATSAIPSFVLSRTSLDFRFENNIDRISQIHLRITNTNSSGLSCVHAIPEAWIKSIQIYANNGSTLLYQQTDNIEYYLINNICLSHEEHETMASLKGTSAVYAISIITVANGATDIIYINLRPLLWKSTHIRPYLIHGNLLIRIQFNPASQIV
jgi:hypothetical protein